MNRTRTIFFGNPDTVIPIAASTAKITQLMGVITNPDQPKGRNHSPTPTSVKQWAQENGIKTFSPETLKDEKIIEEIIDLAPQLFVVAAFGKIIPSRLLMLPSLGAINAHPSLLPRWRGPAPVVHALLAGDTKTGVTLIRLTDAVDAGPILKQVSINLRGDETAGELEQKLFSLGASLLYEIIPLYVGGEISLQPQTTEGITHAPKIKTEHAKLIWSKKAVQLEREVRAFNPEPGSYFFWQRKGKALRIKVWKVITAENDVINSKKGFIVKFNTSPGVLTFKGTLLLEQLQPEGKKVMSGNTFLNGYPDFIGTTLL